MARCKICKGLHDVRADGLCGGCYDNRMAAQFGMSYGKYIGLYGHNLGRRVDTLPDIRRKCPVCDRYLPITAGRHRVFCSRSCAAEMEMIRKAEFATRQTKWR